MIEIYLINNFEYEKDFKIEKIKYKIDEQSIFFELLIILIKILLGENIPEKQIIENQNFHNRKKN